MAALGGIAAAGIAAVLVGVVTCNHAEPAADVRYASRQVDRIAAGTLVADKAPEGWSDLVFKTHSQLAGGDVQSLPEFSRSLAELFFTAMVVRVAPPSGDGARQYRLEKVAIGMGTRVGRDDMIVTSETQRKLGANLGPLKATVLSQAEERLNRIRLVAQSDSMAVVDAPTVMYSDNQHRNVVLRYLFLADPQTGQLASVVWKIDLDDKRAYGAAAKSAVLMQPNIVATLQLHVDKRKFFLGIPGDEAFAATAMPPGTALPIPKAAGDIAGRQELTVAVAVELDAAFRSLVRFHTPTRGPVQPPAPQHYKEL